MLITKKIRSIEKHLKHIAKNKDFYIGVEVNSNITKILQNIGFNYPLIIGEKLLPSKDLGRASRINADGYEIVRKDLPKETTSRQIQWTWKEFAGRNQTIEKTKIADVPYQRYQRTKFPPFATELEIKEATGKLLAVAGPFKNTKADFEKATNCAQMFIEIFQRCHVFDANFYTWMPSKIIKLNWELLPAGQNPWKSSQIALAKFINLGKAGNQPVIKARFDAIGAYNPDYVAIGINGFSGYVIFGFKNKGVCILESNQTNNATYVLPDSSWANISQLSKAEILSNQLHKDRLIHTEKWFSHLKKSLS
ncbi:hypothetical protein [Polynucleobacter sp.]|uniref:hypothetical protein n=1 Tax=Polynucleobacter sp. TaxID=2029855 RepID=UPI003F69CC1E